MPLLFSNGFKRQLLEFVDMFEALERRQERERLLNHPNWDRNKVLIETHLEALRSLLRLDGIQRTRRSHAEYIRLRALQRSPINYQFN